MYYIFESIIIILLYYYFKKLLINDKISQCYKKVE
nr:MAG TPA: hypothetical protein [Caudoviricetes sp.]